jgi:hypothetical protein
MKKTVLFITALILASFTFISGACTGYYSYTDPGELVKQERTVSGFNAIEISGAFEVFLYQGNTESLVVEAGTNIIDKIITEVRGNTLQVHTEKGCCKNAGPMAIYLTFVDLKLMDISGACEMTNEGTLRLEDLEMELSGASEINFSMDLDKLEMDLSGASEIEFDGSCGQVYIDASGASEIKAFNFEVASMYIDASGASDCKVFVTDELQVDASGATSVRYKGNPKVTADKSGASSIKPY